MSNDLERRTAEKVGQLVETSPDWVSLTTGLSDLLSGIVSFTRSCWHTVDPGTVMLTGSANHRIQCSGSWLAEHEYVIDDVNRWWFLARSSEHVNASSIATHGDLTRSARHRSQEAMGIGDELRAAFVLDGVYWGAAAFLRDEGAPWFDRREVELLTALAPLIAAGLRRSLLVAPTRQVTADPGPAVVVYDERGEVEEMSTAAAAWIAEMNESPPPTRPEQSKIVQSVAVRARTLSDGQDPLGLEARARVRTRSGRWLLLYGTRLSGGDGGSSGRTAVVIQPAPTSAVAPLVAQAYGLTIREREVTQLCLQGRSTKEMSRALGVSAYTVQDHLKGIFSKTGVRSRGELVGQVFLEHYVPRWQDDELAPPGWFALTEAVPGP